MINFDEYANENKTKHNLKRSYIPDHPCRILIIGGSGFRKANALLNLISNQPDIDKIYFYAKDTYQAKYQFLINKEETQNNINNNKKLNSVVTELFIRARQLNVSIVFVIQSYFKVPKDVRLKFTHFFNMKTQNKRKL